MDAIRSILLTTDFSDTSAKAFAAARALAERFGARIVVVHVEDDRVSPLLVEYMAVGLESIRQRQVENARRQLDEFVSRHLGPEADVDREVSLGVPHAEIVRLATERKVDLIVMATLGRGFISHAMMGSTTERVLRRAPCPVLVVPG
jgi:nucleotide-binding universal stress UspA family protein